MSREFAQLEQRIRSAGRVAALRAASNGPVKPEAPEVPFHNGDFRQTIIAAANGQILPFNGKRRYLLIQNKAGFVQFLGIGVTASPQGIQLAASGGSYELIYWVATNPIYVSGGGPLIVIEG